MLWRHQIRCHSRLERCPQDFVTKTMAVTRPSDAMKNFSPMPYPNVSLIIIVVQVFPLFQGVSGAVMDKTRQLWFLRDRG